MLIKSSFESIPIDDISPTPCKHCTLPEKFDNESTTSTDETDINYSTIDSYESEENDFQPAFHPLPQSDVEYDFTLITGASKNHFCPMKSFLYHMKDRLEGLNARIIVYDLGFSKSQRNTFIQLQELGYLTELRTF